MISPVISLAFTVAIIALAFLASHSANGRRIVSYGSAILIMIYVCSQTGIFLLGLIPSKGYASAMAGFFLGVVVGVAAGVMLGRFGVSHLWLYWVMALIVACVLVWLPPLI